MTSANRTQLINRLSMLTVGSLAAALSLMSEPAFAHTSHLCVGPAPGCFRSLGAALGSASDGDTVVLAAGTFSGGVTITKSITLQGAGTQRTILRGGGPVLTIGELGAAREPTVSISSLTVTGGRNQGVGAVADGGGLFVPPGADSSLGATVHISDVAVTRNQVTAVRTVSSVNVKCPTGPCPFAASRGGGIANFGTMSLTHSIVSDNQAAGVASDAIGGGIFSSQGVLSINDTVVSGNAASATIPNGRFAEGGGLFVESGQLAISGSTINSNQANLRSELASTSDAPIEMGANSGGVHVDGDVTATSVTQTTISGNRASATDLAGEPLAFDAGILVGGGHLVMSHSIIDNNTAVASVGTSVDVGGGGSALEVNGGATITDTRITNNPSIARSPHGVAQVSAGMAVLHFDGNPQRVVLRRSIVARNTATAVSDSGTAAVFGGGIINNSLLELDRVDVRNNSGLVAGPTATAQGGGIWNGVLYSGPPVTLTLRNSHVTGNTLTGVPSAELRGGGLFTNTPVDIIASDIASNRPDQCAGCTVNGDHVVTRRSWAAPSPRPLSTAGRAAVGRTPTR